MILTAPGAFMGVAVCASVLFGGCAWYPKALDSEIAVLRKEVDDKRRELTAKAMKYRGAGQDVQLDVSERPIKETLEKFNGLKPHEHLMLLVETRAGGTFEEYSTECWPGGPRIGVDVRPVDYPGAFLIGLYIHKFLYHNWHPTKGLEYALEATFSFGHMALWGEAYFCYGSVPIDAAGVLIAGFNYMTPGNALIAALPDEGIGYTLQLTEPLDFAVNVFIVGVPISGRLQQTPELLKGKVPHIMGKEGKVQIGQNGDVRKFTMDLIFKWAEFIEGGLTTFGELLIHWP